MISKRLLERYRKDALISKSCILGGCELPDDTRGIILDMCNHIIALTQEALDQQLLKGDKKE